MIIEEEMTKLQFKRVHRIMRLGPEMISTNQIKWCTIQISRLIQSGNSSIHKFENCATPSRNLLLKQLT